MSKSEFINILSERGFIHQCTDLDALDNLLSQKAITAYIGFDCTAKSFHVGSLVPIMLLYWLQQTGHKPIVLMGGGTTKVGDPSGKDESRQMLTDEGISENIASLKTIFAKFLSFGDGATSATGATDAVMVNNDDWLNTLEYIEFLRDFGRHFSINRMLSFDSVKLRLEREQPLSFLEFNYMILQAYDFYELNKEYDCKLQLGGSDQWGNIVNGVDLTRRVAGKGVFGLTSPLITTASGAKMGKTADGAVWLNEDMLSSYDYWQFWRNTDDKDVGRFLRLFTTLPIAEIEKLEALQGVELNEAKKVLADEATKMCHGEEASKQARKTAEETFEKGELGEDLPTVEISASELEAGIPMVKLLTVTGLCSSGGEAKRLIRGGGAKINDVKISDEKAVINASYLQDGMMKISAGKKKHAKIIVK